MKALLLSGGLESAALAALELPEICLTINYGQPAAVGEIRSSRAICKELGLTHEAISVPAYSSYDANMSSETCAIFWPLRNQLLITLAGAHLSERGLSDLYIGVVKGDIFGDCSGDFIVATNAVLEIQGADFKVAAPALNWTTDELLRKANLPLELLSLTLSCHVGPFACGACAGCVKSRNALKRYRARSRLSLVASR